MSFDITKYKDWYWCETSGAYTRYFSKISDAEEMPFEFAKEVIKGCDDLIEVDGKPNHYHKCYNGSEFFFEYVIYAFKNKKIIQRVVKQFEEEFNLQKLFNIFKITEKEFFSFSKENINDKNSNIIDLAYDIANWIIDADEDFGIARIPKSFKKYLKKCIEIFKNIKEYSSVMRCSRYFIQNKNLLSYHNFKNNKKKFYV